MNDTCCPTTILKKAQVETYKPHLTLFLFSKRPLNCQFVLNRRKITLLSRQLPRSGCRHCGWICCWAASQIPSVAGRQERRTGQCESEIDDTAMNFLTLDLGLSLGSLSKQKFPLASRGVFPKEEEPE